MPSIADIAVPASRRRVGPAWFVMPLFLVAVWLMTSAHHAATPRIPTLSGVAAGR